MRVRPISKKICSVKENEFRNGTRFPTDSLIKWSEFINIGPDHRIVGTPYRDEGYNTDAIQVTVPCPHFNTEPDLTQEPEDNLKYGDLNLSLVLDHNSQDFIHCASKLTA